MHPPALAARTHHLLAQACPSARLRPCCQARVPASPHARRAYARSPAPCTPARSHVRTAPCPLPSLHAGSQASPRSSPPTSSQPRTAAPAYATQYAHSTCTRIAAGAHSCPHSSPSQLPARAPSTRVCLVLPAHASTHKRSRSPSQSTVLAAARTHSQPTARARTHPHPPVLVASSRPLHLHLPPAAFAATRASTRVVSCSPSAVFVAAARTGSHPRSQTLASSTAPIHMSPPILTHLCSVTCACIYALYFLVVVSVFGQGDPGSFALPGCHVWARGVRQGAGTAGLFGQ